MSQIFETGSSLVPDLNRPSNLERVFDFEDHAFRAYMRPDHQRYGASAAQQPGELMDLHYDMAESGIPLVRLAAGWAAADAALSRQRFSLEDRFTALKIANISWAESARMFAAERAEADDDKLVSETLGHELSAVRAMCNLPLMGVAAATLDSVAAQETRSGAYQQVAGNMRAFAEVLQTSLGEDIGKRGKSAHKKLFGEMHETVALMLLQRSANEGRFYLPASLRQDHHHEQRLRADIVALDAYAPHHETLLQVKSDKHASDAGTGVMRILAKDDLCAGSDKSVLKTLRMILNDADPERRDTLDQMGKALNGRVADFRTRQANS